MQLPIALNLYRNSALEILFQNEIAKERIRQLSLSKQPQVEVSQEAVTNALAILILVRKQADQEHEAGVARELDDKIKNIKDTFPGLSENNLNQQVDNYSNLLKQHGNRLDVKVPAKIVPLVLDHLIRWGLLWFFLRGVIENEPLFWAINMGLGPVVLGLSLIYYRYNLRKNIELLIPFGGIRNIELKSKVSSLQYSLLTAMAVIGVAVVAAVFEPDPDDLIFMTLGIALGYLIYYSIFLQSLSTGALTEQILLEQIDEKEQFRKELTPDENDGVIIELSTRLKALTSRLEAYILESALFGALAFSGFLQIMAEGLVSFENLENFALHFFTLFQHFTLFEWNEMSEVASMLSSKSDLFALISVETLVCSVLFLAVIASRLRFSDVADRITRSLGMAQALNEKEEYLLHKENNTNIERDKLKKINKEIQVQLYEARDGLEEILPVTYYMRYFRNMGILTFLVILISSAFFISSFLSLLFTVLGVFTLIYFNRREIRSISEKIVFQTRMIFMNKGIYILLLSILLYLSGILLRTVAGWHGTDGFLVAGFILLGTYLFVWIVFLPHYDKDFDVAGGSGDTSQDKWWIIVRAVWAIAVFFFIIGYLLKIIHLPASAALMGIGGLGMALVFIIIGFRFVRPGWFGGIIGLFVGGLVMGIVFRFLSLPGAKPLISLSGIAVLVSFIYYFFNRKRFHRMFISAAIVVLGFAILLLAAPNLVSDRAYDHYTINREKLGRIAELVSGSWSLDNMMDTEIDQVEFKNRFETSLKDATWYMNEFDQSAPWAADRRRVVWNYTHVAVIIYANKKGSKFVEWGYQISRHTNLLGKEIGYDHEVYSNMWKDGPSNFVPWLEPLFLVEMGKEEEAKNAIHRIESELKFPKDSVMLEARKLFGELY